MKNINSHFSAEELKELKRIDVEFDPEHDYSDDELIDIHEKITENFPYEYEDDRLSEPKPLGRIFESIVDKFYKDFSI